MIRHIVCFKLKDHSEEACETARDILLSMKDNVPLVREISVGIDFLHSPRSYDLILQVTLDNREALNDYQEDALFFIRREKTNTARTERKNHIFFY